LIAGMSAILYREVSPFGASLWFQSTKYLSM
jgi:hypothetical protein